MIGTAFDAAGKPTTTCYRQMRKGDRGKRQQSAGPFSGDARNARVVRGNSVWAWVWLTQGWEWKTELFTAEEAVALAAGSVTKRADSLIKPMQVTEKRRIVDLHVAMARAGNRGIALPSNSCDSGTDSATLRNAKCAGGRCWDSGRQNGRRSAGYCRRLDELWL